MPLIVIIFVLFVLSAIFGGGSSNNSSSYQPPSKPRIENAPSQQSNSFRGYADQIDVRGVDTEDAVQQVPELTVQHSDDIPTISNPWENGDGGQVMPRND